MLKTGSDGGIVRDLSWNRQETEAVGLRTGHAFGNSSRVV